jgi:predicted enzyme related to lactoylglutathione lyase
MSDTLTAPEAANANDAAPQGNFIWYELLTTDQEAAIAFYIKVVGWTAADYENSQSANMRYTILSAGERGVGGIFQLNQQMLDGGARPGWLGYIGVPDTDARAKAIASAGGAVHIPPSDIPNVGRFAMVADPGGAVFYLMTPLPQDEPPAVDPETPGHVSWRELYAAQGQEQAFAFYSAQFGWRTETEMDMGPMGKYRIFGRDGVQMGGMMDKPENVPASAWTYYINVDGIDAAVERVKANGGQVLMGPMEVPGGSWIIQGLDPQGANFALVSKTR